MLNGVLMLNVTLLGGTRFSTLANGVLVFAAFGVAFVGGWIEQIGSFLNSEAAVNVGIVSSLLLVSKPKNLFMQIARLLPLNVSRRSLNFSEEPELADLKK